MADYPFAQVDDDTAHSGTAIRLWAGASIPLLTKLVDVANFLIDQIFRFTAALACCGLCRNGHGSGRIWMRLKLTGQYSHLRPHAGVP